MVDVVANGGRDQDGQLMSRQHVVEAAGVDQAVHHLRHAETVPEIVERIVAVVLLDGQLRGRINAMKIPLKKSDALVSSCYQPTTQGDRVDVQLVNDGQLFVHELEQDDHLGNCKEKTNVRRVKRRLLGGRQRTSLSG